MRMLLFIKRKFGSFWVSIWLSMSNVVFLEGANACLHFSFLFFKVNAVLVENSQSF